MPCTDSTIALPDSPVGSATTVVQDQYLERHGRPEDAYPAFDLDGVDEQRHTMIVTFTGGAKKAIVPFMGRDAGQDSEHRGIDVLGARRQPWHVPAARNGQVTR